MSLVKHTLRGLNNLKKNYVEAVVKNANFKRWFGDSVVVEKSSGLPLILFHGTEKDWIKSNSSFRYDTKQYQFGMHFGTEHSAFDRISFLADVTSSSNIIPVYLKIENPFFTVDMAEWDKPEEWIDILSNNKKTRPYLKNSQLASWDKEDNSSPSSDLLMDVIDIITKSGYDGAIYTNQFEDVGSQSFVVFDNKQIKSIFNEGTFDPNNSNIFK